MPPNSRFALRSGIAIGPILFMVAILAILATAIASGASSWSSDQTRESDQTMASAIIGIGKDLQAGVARVMSHGCADTQISFENPVVSSYVNS